jgi:phytoene dehydrogenase-like protein
VLRDLVIIYHMWSARCSRGCLRARAPRRHVPPRRALSTSAAVDAALGSTTTAASGSNADLTSRRWDAIIVGGGHNGLTTAAYLAKAGKSVLVLERRHVLGGAAVTEEMVPGFHFSRASYLCSLLRPAVIKELELVRHGLRFHPRPHSSFTPLLDGRSLLMGDAATTRAEIAKFSPKDAEAYAVYEAEIEKFADILEAVLDSIPPDPAAPRAGGLKELAEHAATLGTLARHGRSLGGQLGPFIELLTAPASRVLERWFESEPLMSTLATDAVIGAMMSPETPGSGYVLLHHVMGETDGARGISIRKTPFLRDENDHLPKQARAKRKENSITRVFRIGVWAYVEGGMGAVSATIAAAAEEAGATLRTHAPVRQIVARDGVGVAGVELLDGTLIESNNVFSNATPHVTLNGLLGKEGQAMLPASVMARLETADYSSGTTKINLAVNSLPQFSCKPPHHGVPQPEHQGTIHLGCESLSQMHEAFADASEHGEYSQLPLIEMTIPSALDPTLAPPGCHVINLFVQYTPYALSGAKVLFWTPFPIENDHLPRQALDTQIRQKFE